MNKERSADLASLHELNRNYVRSVQESDVRWFEQHLAADFMNSNPDGTIVDRAGFLAQMAKPTIVRNLMLHEPIVRIMGDFAIIHARTSYTKPDGTLGAGRYTDDWQRCDGRWLCISAHVTRG